MNMEIYEIQTQAKQKKGGLEWTLEKTSLRA